MQFQVIKPRIYRILRIRVIRVNSWLEKGNSYAIKLIGRRVAVSNFREVNLPAYSY